MVGAYLLKMDFVDLKKGDNTSCRVHLFGATLTSWQVEGTELIFVSPKAVFDNKKAIRGGIPVCFPSFGPWAFGPQHGFARTSVWQVLEPVETQPDGDVSVTMRLTDTEESRKLWDLKFSLDYKIVLGAEQLSLELKLTNSSDQQMDFTTALHTYFRVKDVRSSRVLGLTGLTFVDKTLPDTPLLQETREEVVVEGWTDRVYLGLPPGSSIHVEGVEGGSLELSSSNLPDTVLWNPWQEKAAEMSDLGGEAWPGFLCVETGQCVDPVQLGPGQTWAAAHSIKYKKQ